MKWLYNNSEIDNISQLPDSAFGFIYITTHIPTQQKYLGKKFLIYNKKKKLTKKELSEQTGRGRKPTHKKIQVESDWKSYYGSAGYIKQLLSQNKHNEFKREIIDIGYNKKHLTYLECRYLFANKVLESPDEWLNDNILGKFFSDDIISLKDK